MTSNNRERGALESTKSTASVAAGAPPQFFADLYAGAMATPPPPFRYRFWRRLGFNGSYEPRLLDFRYAELEGYAESSIMTETKIYFPIIDRLRVLISGCVRVEFCTRTDTEVRRSKTMAQVTIMSPGFVTPPPGLRHKWRPFVACLAILPLLGCAAIGNPFETGEQIAAREAAEDAGYCRSYGIQYGTEDFQRCTTGRQELRRQDELIIALRNGYAPVLVPSRRMCAIYHWGGPYAELECR